MITKKKVRKPKKAFAYINVPIYGSTVIVSINQTDDELLKSVMKARGLTDKTLAKLFISQVMRTESKTLGLTSHIEGVCIVRVFDELKTPEEYNTLVHELFHATDFILDHRGMSLVNGSEEAYAYLIGFLMEKTMEACK